MEAAFFVLGVLPYWYTLYLPEKSLRFWTVLVWCCCIWIIYFSHHGATAALVNNVVELGLAAWGWRRCRRAGARTPSPAS